MPSDLPVETLAKRTADARRVLMNTFRSDLGLRMAVDLMGIAHPSTANLHYAKIIAETHHATLADSMLFVADADMVDLLDVASSTMPDQHLHATDIITPHGFVYFAQPLPDKSGTPPEIPIHAFSWAFLEAGSPLLAERDADDSILITSYVTLTDSLLARSMYKPGDVLAPNLPKYIPNATAMWTVGSLIGKVFGEEPPNGGYTPGFYQRIAAAFWTLAQQPKLTTTTHESPGKPVDQRRNRRAGVTDPNAPVHVIRLHHRPTDPDNNAGNTAKGTGHKMTVRSAVRGHWRRQFYRSVNQHRHIWIDPHWRGPEDAPVVGGERVFLATGPKVDPGQQ